MPDLSFAGFDLGHLLDQTYVAWNGIHFGSTGSSRSDYLDKVRFQSYFVWLQKGLQELYGMEEVLSADNWDRYSEAIEDSHRDASFHLRVLKGKCRYEKVILDTYWDPGSDNAHLEIFSPAFRIDPLLYGCSESAADHDGNSPWELYGGVPGNLSDYITWVDDRIRMKKQQGSIALKCAAAYARDLEFQSVSKERAERIFRKDSGKSEEEIRDFQNYIFAHICRTAAELELPFQIHTGLGQLTGTRAIGLKDVIKENPETKFVLLHCGYPWTEDVIGLFHVYPNIYPDLAWLPILSPASAKRTLHELIEAGAQNKICWGCDTWTAEESFGALLAFRHVMADVLEEKIRDGWFGRKDAEMVIQRIMEKNADLLYQIK
jgi:hypothetical protein